MATLTDNRLADLVALSTTPTAIVTNPSSPTGVKSLVKGFLLHNTATSGTVTVAVHLGLGGAAAPAAYSSGANRILYYTMQPAETFAADLSVAGFPIILTATDKIYVSASQTGVVNCLPVGTTETP